MWNDDSSTILSKLSKLHVSLLVKRMMFVPPKYLAIFMDTLIIMSFKALTDRLPIYLQELFINTIMKGYSTLGVHYRDLQARVHEQETRNLTLHEAQPSAVLNFEFLVRERVLVNPIMHEQRVLKTF